MPAALGFGLDRLLRLLLGADEEDRARRRDATSRMNVMRLVEELDGLLEVDDVDAVAPPKMYGFILGFQRRVW